MKNNKVLSLIGLATKAGKTVSGEFSTEKSVKTGKGFLALVADDASENTKKKFRNMCTYYEVPLRQREPGQSNGQRIPCQPCRAGRKFCKGDHEGAGKRIRQITCMIQASVRRFDDRNDKR